jgi:hypothetical protein
MSESKTMGRPPVPPEKKLVPITVKVEPETREKVLKHGSAWVRQVLKRAKPPKE